MQCVRAKIIYTGRKKLANAYLVFNRDKVVGVSKSRKGKLLSLIHISEPTRPY